MKSIVSPATGITAPAIAPQAVSKGVFDFTAAGQLINLANFTGVPGLVLRWDTRHLAYQLVCSCWGVALESSGAFPLKKPSTFYDLLSTV